MSGPCGRIAVGVSGCDILEAADGHVEGLLAAGQGDSAREVHAAHVRHAVGCHAVQDAAARIRDDARCFSAELIFVNRA